MVSERRLIDYKTARNATYEEVFWSESEQAVVRNFLAKLPRADAVEVPDAQVRKTVELLCKNYEAAKKKPFVQHPLAYALFHTWKEIDRGVA